MGYTNFAEEAVLHSRVWKALLRSAMEHGSQFKIAERTRISEVYLSNLMQPDHPPPSIDVERRLAEVLPFDHERRQDFLNHLSLARENRSALGKSIREGLRTRGISDLVHNLQRQHHLSTFHAQADKVDISYRAVREAGYALTNRMKVSLSPVRFGMEYAQVLLVMHDTESILNRHGEAMFNAERVSSILTAMDERVYRGNRERVDYLRVNALYALAITYNNLGLSQEALLICLRAEHEVNVLTHASAFWLPHIYRAKMKAISCKPRFALSDVRNLFNNAQAFLEKADTPLSPLFSLMLSRSFAEALIEYSQRYASQRSLREAEHLIQSSLSQIDQISDAGPLHRVGILRTSARLYRHQGSSQSSEYAQQAWSIAAQYGLHHQMRQIQEEFGTLVSS